MTGIVFLDANFKPVSAPVDDFSSLIWSSRYYASGSFSSTLPAIRYKHIKDAAYVYNPDNGGCAMFDQKLLEVTGEVATLKGSSLEALLNGRTVLVETTLTGNLETAIHTLITVNAMTGARVIPHLTLAPATGFAETVLTIIKAGTKLSDALRTVLKAYGMSYTITLDYLTSTLIFKIVKGKDRTQSQGVNSWAIFSTQFENLQNASYEKIETDYANYAYVTAVDSEYGTVVIAVNESAGPDRREIYVSSSATSTNEDESVMTLDEYKNLLASAGYESLAENAIAENSNGDIDTHGSLKYGTNYSLGDWCDIVVAEHDLSWEAQITAVDEVYEGGSKRIVPAFGEESVASLKQYINQQIKNESRANGATSAQYEELDVLSAYIKLRDKNKKVVYDSDGDRVCVENSVLGAGVYRSKYTAAQMDKFIVRMMGV